MKKYDTFLFENSPKAYFVANIAEKQIIYYNPIALSLYGMHQITHSLEEIFEFSQLTLHEMIQNLLQDPEKNTVEYLSLFTIKLNEEHQLIDLLIGYVDEEKTALFLEFTLKEDDRERKLKELMDNTSKAMFCSKTDEHYSIYYGNDLFYEIFCENKEDFQSKYDNSFLSTLVGEDLPEFRKDIRERLKINPDFHKDIRIIDRNGMEKWFYLDVQYRTVSRGARVLYALMIPISNPSENQSVLLQEYLKAVQEVSSGAIFYINAESKRGSHHSVLLKEAGFPDQIDNFPHCLLPLFHPEDGEGFVEYAKKMLKGSTESHEVRYVTGENAYSWSRINASPIRDKDGKVLEVVGKIKNIDVEKELVERVILDPLTKTYSEEFAREKIEAILEESDEDSIHAFFFMDLDDFAQVNKTLGHEFGDFLLEQLGKRLGGQLRSDDIIGRAGGDEFIFLLKNITNIENLYGKASNLLKTIRKSFTDGEVEHTIQGSIGIAIYPLHGTTCEELYEHADKALYRSKHRGKNMATIYKPSMNETQD